MEKLREAAASLLGGRSPAAAQRDVEDLSASDSLSYTTKDTSPRGAASTDTVFLSARKRSALAAAARQKDIDDLTASDSLSHTVSKAAPVPDRDTQPATPTPTPAPQPKPSSWSERVGTSLLEMFGRDAAHPAAGDPSGGSPPGSPSSQKSPGALARPCLRVARARDPSAAKPATASSVADLAAPTQTRRR